MSMNPTITKKDRFLGCFLGGAVGDALGYAVEFVDEAYIQKKYGPQGIQTLDQAGEGGPAVISDDTQMTLFVINGLLYGMTSRTIATDSHTTASPAASSMPQKPLSDAEAVWLAHQEWLGTQGDTSRMEDPTHPKMWIYHEPALHALRAPGGTCLSAIRENEHGGSLGHKVNNSKGCGAVMKAAPFGLREKFDPVIHMGNYRIGVYKCAADLGAQTHGHPLGYMSASALAVLLASIVHYEPDGYETLQDAVLKSFTGSHNACHEIYTGLKTAVSLALDPSISDLDGIHQLGEGWVAEEALYIAIFCAVRYQNDFAKAIRVAVNHKGDSDSTGSICGNILGAWLGKDAVAAAYDLENLEMRDLIEEVATDFYRAVEEGIPVGDVQWDTKYRLGRKLTPEELSKLLPSKTTSSPLRSVGLRYTERTKRALQICFDAHKNQTDKGGMPYLLHPIHLAEQMETEDEICTALLHDVLEDTHYTEDDLHRAGISEAVLEALRLLTHDRSTPYMEYIIGTRQNSLARKVKQADLLHNSDIDRLDQITICDLRRRRKYRMALAILEEDVYDTFCKQYRKRIPLDDDRQYFLSVFYQKEFCDRAGALGNGHGDIQLIKYSLDVEKDGDSHYEFAPADGDKLHAALDVNRKGVKRSLPETLAEYLESHGTMSFCGLLKQLGILYQPFHFD